MTVTPKNDDVVIMHDAPIDKSIGRFVKLTTNAFGQTWSFLYLSIQSTMGYIIDDLDEVNYTFISRKVERDDIDAGQA